MALLCDLLGRKLVMEVVNMVVVLLDLFYFLELTYVKTWGGGDGPPNFWSILL